MFKRGEVYDNPVTGERIVIRLGTQETGGERLVLVQRALFGILAPIARLKGYRGSYPEYETRAPLHVLSEESPGLMPLAS